MKLTMKMTLNRRLAGMMVILTILAISIGLLGLYGMRKSDEGLKSVYQNRTVALEQISRIEALIVENQLSLAEALQDSMVVTINAKSVLINKNMDEINKTWAIYMASEMSPAERALAEKFASERNAMLNDGVLLAMKTMRDGDLATANDIQTKVEKMAPGVRSSVSALRTIQVDGAQGEYEQSRQRTTALSGIMTLVIIVGAMVAVLLGRILIKSVYRQLGGEPEYASSIVHSIAEGNLAINIMTEPKDQHSLLFAMKTMQRKLAQTVGNIRESTITIAMATQEILDGNIELSSRTEKQAGALEETAASMTLLTSSVHQNADHAAQANALSNVAAEVALKGSAAVVQVVDSMRAIDQSSRKISDIISVIDGIAFQTNILALNAAVEAARAGEQGRGFAVVATEVRDLAQRSASAAKEIKQLITNSVNEVSVGTAIVEQAGITMEEIVSSVRRVTDIMAGISLSSREQHAGISQVNEAVLGMDQATQKNAMLVEEATSASDLLKDQAAMLARLVNVFTLDASSVSEGYVRTNEAETKAKAKAGKSNARTVMSARDKIEAREAARKLPGSGKLARLAAPMRYPRVAV